LREDQTVDLSNKYMTEDFREIFTMVTVDGGQEDHTFDMNLQVDTTEL
jgi:hypothetical protein